MTSHAKQELAKAALEVARNGTWGDLTVSSLAEKAQVARRTFYRHFESLSDVLLFAMRQLGESVGNAICGTRVVRGARPFPDNYLNAIFGYWRGNRNLLRNLAALNFGLQAVEMWVAGVGGAVHRIDLDNWNELWQIDYLATFMGTGLSSVLLKWACEDDGRSASEVSALFGKTLASLAPGSKR